jgi:hypothetical protein
MIFFINLITRKTKIMIKRLNIQAYQIALVIENRMLTEVLTKGKYWIIGNKEVFKFEQNEPFTSKFELNTLLKNNKLASLLEVIDVMDNEIVIQYQNGIFKDVLTTGQYAFWKGVHEFQFKKVDLSKVEISEAISTNILENVRLKQFVRKFTVLSNEAGLLYVNGKLENQLTAGNYYFWNNAISMELKTVDLRQQQMEISGQEILTKDKATLRINFYAKYQITNAIKAVIENKEAEKQLYILLQLALRAYIGCSTLDELLIKKNSIVEAILVETKTKIETLGINVLDAGIRDIILPGEMKEIMNQVLVAEKKAQANSIMRREETAATRSLLNTAKLMEENEMLWKLKEMEYVEKIADRIGEITISGSGNVISQLKEIFVK